MLNFLKAIGTLIVLSSLFTIGLIFSTLLSIPAPLFAACFIIGALIWAAPSSNATFIRTGPTPVVIYPQGPLYPPVLNPAPIHIHTRRDPFVPPFGRAPDFPEPHIHGRSGPHVTVTPPMHAGPGFFSSHTSRMGHSSHLSTGHAPAGGTVHRR